MPFIDYVTNDEIPAADQVADNDNIIQVHGIHSRVMKLHYDLYMELMHADGPLPREERESIAVLCSTINRCHY